MSELTRRRFCLVAGGLVAGACGGGGAVGDGGADMRAGPTDMAVTRDLADPTCPVNGKANVGPASSFALGEVRLLLCAQIFVVRDVGGIYAMSALCTHEMCIVDYAPATNDFGCPCHGSVFDINGAVTQSPANMPLPHYACSLDGNGDVIVDLSSTNVAPSTRLVV